MKAVMVKIKIDFELHCFYENTCNYNFTSRLLHQNKKSTKVNELQFCYQYY